MAKKRTLHDISNAVLPFLLAGVFAVIAYSVIQLGNDAPTGLVVLENSCQDVVCGFNSQCEQGQCVCMPNHYDATCDETPDVDEDIKGCTPSRICSIY